MIASRPLLQSVCICLLAVLYLPQPAFGVDRTIRQYVHTAWGEKEGAPSGIVALAQTNDGYLWIGSVDGLYRFDGVAFELYKPGLVYALLSRPNGDLWVGRKGEITLLRNARETTYTVRDGVPDGKVAGFSQDSEGAIWVATNEGLARFEGDHWVQAGKNWNFPGKTATGMCLDRNGTLWVATESTIVFLPRGARSFHATEISSGQVWVMAEAPNGKLWMAETTRSVRSVPLGSSLMPSDKTEIIRGSIGILFDEEGALWITTLGDGMRRVSHPEELKSRKYEGGNAAIEAFTSKDGLTDDIVTAVLEDRESNIWVSTNNGLDCFRKGALVPVVSSEPLLQPILGVGDNGEMWIFSHHGMMPTEGSDKLNVRRVSDLYLRAYRDPDGIIWWSGNGFVSRMKDGRSLRIPPKTTKAPFPLLPFVTEDHDGVLWASVQYDGIFYLKENVWRRFETASEVAKLDPSAAFTDWMGRVWFGFDGGGALVTLQQGQLHVIAASGQSPVGPIVNAITGRGQHIWIGGRSLVYFEGSNFHPVAPFDVNEFEVVGLEEAIDGSLWLSDRRGVVHIPVSEVHKFLENYSYRVQYELFDSADGLPGSFHDAAAWMREAQGTDGRLWFGATKGVAWLDPAAIPKNTLPPPVSIRSLDADGRRYAESTRPVLPPRPGTVRIAYSAPSLSVPLRVRFRYRLEGVDHDWENPGTRREAFYTGLAPGTYRFRVIACNNDGVWNEAGAFLDFSILPTYYQTAWFRALCTAAFLLLLWFIYQLRLRQIRHQFNIGLEVQVTERVRIARDLHDTFLQTIQGSKLVADSALKQSSDPARMRGALEQLSIWLGRATEEGRAALSSLRTSATERNDLAAAFQRAIEECRINRSMEASFSVIGEVSEMHPIIRDEVYRIGYEAIRNACVHSQATQLQVELTYAQDLTLRVRDNGVGIAPAIVDGGKEEHFGLQGMRERAGRIIAKFTINTSPGSGTEMKLVVPGGIIYRRTNSGGRKWPRIESLLKRLGLKSKSTDS